MLRFLLCPVAGASASAAAAAEASLLLLLCGMAGYPEENQHGMNGYEEEEEVEEVEGFDEEGRPGRRGGGGRDGGDGGAYGDASGDDGRAPGGDSSGWVASWLGLGILGVCFGFFGFGRGGLRADVTVLFFFCRKIFVGGVAWETTEGERSMALLYYNLVLVAHHRINFFSRTLFTLVPASSCGVEEVLQHLCGKL